MIAGRPVALEPSVGLGAQLARALAADAERVLYRLERVADAREGRPEAGDAGRSAMEMLDRVGVSLPALLRGLGERGPSNATCAALDQQRLDDRAGIARNGPSRASVDRGGPRAGASAHERREAERRDTMAMLDRIARGRGDVIDAEPEMLRLGVS